MTIETKLMQSFKTNIGLILGQGISNSVISKWIVEMSVTHDISASVVFFSLFSFEQHVDFSMTRITRNITDIGKLAAWFNNNPPFSIMSEIITIINFCEAVTIGKLEQVMGKIEGIPFSDRALPLSSVTSSINIQHDTVAIDPFLLFQRIYTSIKTDNDLRMYLEYGLAPLPLALFSESGMRKTKKSGMCTLFSYNKKGLEHIKL
ncbi:hypothetical protein PR048_018066 [Dryococelus australis]|uniref:Uncharacterized protein n=1 Tax=Dryococelus australis TaxID=614101 RepID=A0ABQ9HB76_9NEOP|nr:hypothetical protein PR048_018066 [Dryococelus australis]